MTNPADPTVLQIDGFTMRPLQSLDLDVLASIWADPEVTRFLPSQGVPIPREKTGKALHKAIRRSSVEKRILIASWLFLIGSSLFLIDSMFEVAQHFSPMSLLHLSEGVLFLMGSIFFMPSSSGSSPSPPKTDCNSYSKTQEKLALVATDCVDE